MRIEQGKDNEAEKKRKGKEGDGDRRGDNGGYKTRRTGRATGSRPCFFLERGACEEVLIVSHQDRAGFDTRIKT